MENKADNLLPNGIGITSFCIGFLLILLSPPLGEWLTNLRLQKEPMLTDFMNCYYTATANGLQVAGFALCFLGVAIMARWVKLHWGER